MATVTMQTSSPTVVQPIPQLPTPSALPLSAGVPSSPSSSGAPKYSYSYNAGGHTVCYLPFDDVSRVHLEEKTFSPSPELPNVATSIRKPNIDWTLEDVPKSAATVQEAVRHDYMRRLLTDTSTREERVNAVLQPDLQKVNLVDAKSSSPAGDTLVAELMASKENPWTLNPGLHDAFVNKFQRSDETLKAKAGELQKTYLELDRKWSVHCRNLDAEIAAQPPEPEPTPPPKTQVRATRRGLVAVQNGEAVLADPLSLNNTPQPPEIHDPEATIKRADRNAAKIPDMLSVSDLDRARLQYNDTNLDVTEHAEEFFALRTGIFDWTEDERTIFFETYIRHPKAFWRVADELPNKTVAQCVAYYYLHKKHLIDFRHGQGKKRKGGRRPKTRRAGGLLADIVQHDAEMAGPATRSRTGTAAPDPKRTAGRRGIPTPFTSQANTPEPEGRPKRKRAIQPSSRTREYDMFEDTDDDEPPARRAGRKPKKRQYKSAATIEDEDEPMPLAAPVPQAALKPSGLAVLVDAALAAVAAAAAAQPTQAPSSPQVASTSVTPPSMSQPSPILQHQHKFKLGDIDDQAAAARKRTLPGHTVWGDSDKDLFLKLVAQYGDDYKRIASSMPNKTTLQVRSYFATHAAEFHLNELVAKAPKRSPSPGQEQPSSSSTGSAQFANSSASMSVLNFSKTLTQTVPGSYYKSRETHQPRDLTPNTFMLDKNGEVRFSVKEHMQMSGGSMPSSSKAPAMDSLNNDGGSAASRASSSPQLPVLQTTFNTLTAAQAWPRFQGSTPGPSSGATTLPPFSFSTSKTSSSRSSSSSTTTPAADTTTTPTTPSAPPGQMLQSLPAGFMNSLHQVQPYPLFAATNIQAYGQPTQFPNPPHHPHPSHHQTINPYGYGPFPAYQLYPLATQRQFLSATATAGGDAPGQTGGPVGRPGLGFYFSSSPSSS